MPSDAASVASKMRTFETLGAPPHEDRIRGFGSIGFGQPGVEVCPVIVGACEFTNGSCRVTSQVDCLRASGINWSEDTECDTAAQLPIRLPRERPKRDFR